MNEYPSDNVSSYLFSKTLNPNKLAKMTQITATRYAKKVSGKADGSKNHRLVPKIELLLIISLKFLKIFRVN